MGYKTEGKEGEQISELKKCHPDRSGGIYLFSHSPQADSMQF